VRTLMKDEGSGPGMGGVSCSNRRVIPRLGLRTIDDHGGTVDIDS